MDIFAELDQQLADNDIAVALPIRKQDGTPFTGLDGKTQSTISVVGPESTAAKAIERVIFTRNQARRGMDTTLDDVMTNRIDRAAALVTAWSGWYAGDSDVPCTPENVKAVFRKAEHILLQVESGIARHAAFLALAKAS